MSLIQMPKMILSFHEGWDDLIRVHPSVAKLFVQLVLPFSLLAAVMIYSAGTKYGDVFVPGVTPDEWQRAALVFFAAELATVPFIAWIIHFVVRLNNVEADYRDCFVLASIAPVPLWLSSLGLLLPSLFVNVAIGMGALASSFGLIYHGVATLFRIGDETRAEQMAGVICGTGLVAWLLLMQIMLVH